MTLTAARNELKRIFHEIDKWTHDLPANRTWHDIEALAERATTLVVAINSAFEAAKATQPRAEYGG